MTNVKNRFEFQLDTAVKRQAARALVLPWELPGIRDFMPGSRTLGIPFPTYMPLAAAVPMPAVASNSCSSKMSLDVGSAVWARAAKNLKDFEWRQNEDAARDRAMLRVKVVVATNLEQSELGRTLVSEIIKFQSDSRMKQIIVDTFAKKSTSTILKRTGAMLLFLVWYRTKHADVSNAFPLQEGDVYDYFCQLRIEGRVGARCDGLLQSINFFAATIGLVIDPRITSLGRCSGAAFSMVISSRPSSQAPLFTVDEVRTLEAMVFGAPGIVDKLIAGFACLLVSLRSRFHDAMTAERLLIDVNTESNGRHGFLEAHTRRSKTSNTKERKRRFLPMVGPAFLFHDRSWAIEWLQLREDAGLRTGPDIPLMPAPSIHGGWCSRPLSTGEFNDWLNNVFKPFVDVDGKVRRRSSHACKAVLLSWMAKIGASGDVRRMLGYHSNPSESSLITYGRDNTAFPLRELVKCINAVREHNFMPDESRSGMMAADFLEPEPQAVVEYEDEEGFTKVVEDEYHMPASVDDADDYVATEIIADADVADCSSSDSSSDSDSDESVLLSRDIERHISSELGYDAHQRLTERGFTFYRNKFTHVVHGRKSTGGNSVFTCGRLPGHSYVRVNLINPVTDHKCAQCFPKPKP
jgi:hypothetical protein